MAEMFKFHAASMGANSLQGAFDLETGMDYFQQDVSNHIADAKRQRDMEEYFGHQKKSGLRKLATIPDGVALRILQDHGLDLHDPNFNDNPANMTRLKKILVSEYRDLVINT